MKKRKIIGVIAGVVLILLALALILYPQISNWYIGRHQSAIHTEYSAMVDDTDNSVLEEAQGAAREYNAMLVPGIREAEAWSEEALKAAQESYSELLNLAGDGLMGYVEIPKINCSLPVFHEDTDMALERGVAHVLGSSLPVGGSSTHTILAAHSGMSGQRMFTDLENLEIGDVFYLEVLGETMAYEVDQMLTVLPYETDALGIEAGQDYCTLVTCVPYGVNTHRLLVRGHRVELVVAEEKVEEQGYEEQQSVSTWQEQYLKGILAGLALVAILAILMALIWGIRKILRNRRRERNE